jgi:hypothetical protein
MSWIIFMVIYIVIFIALWIGDSKILSAVLPFCRFIGILILLVPIAFISVVLIFKLMMLIVQLATSFIEHRQDMKSILLVIVDSKTRRLRTNCSIEFYIQNADNHLKEKNEPFCIVNEPKKLVCLPRHPISYIAFDYDDIVYEGTINPSYASYHVMYVVPDKEKID